MAFETIKATVGSANGIDGRYFSSAGPTTGSLAAASTTKTATAAAVAAAPSTAAVAAAVATLVADGASPTQAHVTTLNTAWGTLLTAINAQVALVATADTDAGLSQTGSVDTSGDVTLVLNTATVTNMNQLKSALDAAVFAARQAGLN